LRFPCALSFPADAASVDLGVEWPLVAATHHILLCLVLQTIAPSVELSRTRSKVCASCVVHPVCVAGNTIVVFPILLSAKAHNHTLVSCRASSAGRCVDLDGVDENLAGLCRAFVGIYIADWVDCVGTVCVTVAPTEVFSSTMAADWVFLRTVAIVIQPPTSNCTVFPTTVEAVVMTWNVTGGIKSFAHAAVVVAPKVFNTSVCVLVANVTIWTVNVIRTTTKMVMASIATDWEELWAVAVVDATWSAGHIVTVEAVFVIRDVTNGIMARAVIIQLIATIRNTLLVVAISIQVSCVTNLPSLAVFIGVASAKVLRSSMSTDGMRSWTVVVCGAAFCAVCCGVTEEAVVVGRDVTNRIKTRTLIVVCANLILDAPAAVVAMVTFWAVVVFNALRRTFVIHAGLPWETIASGRNVSTVAIIVNGPNAGGSFWKEVELVVKGERPLVSLFALALPVAVSRFGSIMTTICALKEATLACRTTLPEAAAVL